MKELVTQQLILIAIKAVVNKATEIRPSDIWQVGIQWIGTNGSLVCQNASQKR